MERQAKKETEKMAKNASHICFSLNYLTSSTHRKHYRKQINE